MAKSKESRKDKNEILLNVHIGKSIRARRKQQGLSREDLAGLSDVSLNHIGAIERGEATMSVYVQAKLAKGLKLKDPSELIAAAYKEVYPLMPDYNTD